MPRLGKKTGCPKCGGKKGFQRKVFPKGFYIHYGAWDTDEESMEDDSKVNYIGSRHVRCNDCGRAFRWPLGRVNDFTNDVQER